MRLIDADAFKEYMWKALEETRGCYPDKGEWAEAITEQFCKDIDDQPTIQPERKGKWIKARYVLTSNPPQYVWNCSECGKSVNGYSAVVLTDYCPDCGSYNGGDKDDQR